MAVLAVAAVGSAIGGAIGGTFLGIAASTWGWSIGAAVGNMLFAPDGPDYEGPRLGDLKVTGAVEGSDIPILYGQCRAATQLIWTKDLREVVTKTSSGGKGGGGGSTTTTYTYFGTFAVCVGEFQSQHIRRIWANKKLIYDTSPSAQFTTEEGHAFNLYLGSQTQQPDPLIEAEVGAGNAPAYRGYTYIVFDDIPLVDYGNRLPNIEIEVVTSGNSNIVYEEDLITQNGTHHGPRSQFYDKKRELIIQVRGLTYSGERNDPGFWDVIWIDPSSRTVVDKLTHTIMPYGFGQGGFLWPNDEEATHLVLAGNADGTGSGADVHYVNLDTRKVTRVDLNQGYMGARCPDGFVHVHYTFGQTRINVSLYKEDDDRTFIWSELQADGYHFGETTLPIVTDGRNFLIIGYKDGTDPREWYIISAKYSLYTEWNGSSWEDKLSATRTSGYIHLPFLDGIPGYPRDREALYESATGYYWFSHFWDVTNDNGIQPEGASACYWAVDKNAEFKERFIVEDVNGGGIPINIQGEPNFDFNEETGNIYRICTGIGFEITNLASRTGYIGPSIGSATAWCHYDYKTDTVVGTQRDGRDFTVGYWRLNAVDGVTINLSDVITDICGRVGIPASQLDLTDISDIKIRGYRHTRQTKARGDLEPLLKAFHLDAYQSDWKLKFVKRNNTSVATIDVDWFGATSEEKEADDLYEITIPQEVDLPRSYDVQYISFNNDHNPANALSTWFSGSSQRAASASFPIVFEDQEAKQLADKLLQLSYDSVGYKFSVPLKYTNLDPGDIVNLTLDNANVTARIAKIERGINGIVNLRVVEQSAESVVSEAVAGGVSPAVSISGSSPTQLLLLDTPLLTDTDLDHPGPYMSGYTYSGAFTISSFYFSADNQSFSSFASIDQHPTIGYCTNTPSAVTFEDWDETNTLIIDLIHGQGETITDAIALAGETGWAWGQPGRWEIISIVNMTLQGDGTWHADRILRGRRGTDVHMNSHAANDFIIKLESGDTLLRRSLQTSDIGSTRYYKAVKAGGLIADASSVSWTVGDEPYQPYVPCDLYTSEDTGTRAIILSGTERTRLSGVLGGPNSVTDGVGQDPDITGYRYQIIEELTDTVIRSYDAPTFSYDYSLADQETDYGVSLPSTIRWRVGPISDKVNGVVTRYSEIQEFVRPPIPLLTNAGGNLADNIITPTIELTFS